MVDFQQQKSLKINSTWSTYSFRTSGSEVTNLRFSKYVTSNNSGTIDGKNTLELVDDVANVAWGGSWRMPTYEEMLELRNNCTIKWTSQNGVMGIKLTSKVAGYTDCSIFLPAAGGIYDPTLGSAGSNGAYWTSTLYVGDYSALGKALTFNSNSHGIIEYLRSNGLTVRPVCP